MNDAGSAHFAPAERLAYNFSDKWAAAVERYADYGAIRGFAQPYRQYYELFEVGDVQLTGANSLKFGIGRGITGGSDRLI